MVRGGRQGVSEERALQKFYQTHVEWKIRPYISAKTAFVGLPSTESR
jgi:hypothetical protein